MQRRSFRVAVATGLGLCALWAVPAPTSADDDQWVGVVAGEYLVELKPGATATGVADAVGALAPPDTLAGSNYVRLVLDPAADPNATIDALLGTGGVERAQPNLITTTAGALARKRFFSDHDPASVATAADATRTQPGLADARLGAGTGDGITVAVLDTGVDATHPLLAGHDVSGGFDVIDGDAVPDDLPNGLDDNGDGAVDEAHGHGTYVAGLVAQVASDVRVMPVRVLDSDGTGTAWDVMRGVAWAAANGADVINLSLGGSSAGPLAEQQFERIEGSGIVVVAAAGNGGSEELTYPAAYEGVVAVTSVDGVTGRAAVSANRGSWIDVAAPGVALVSAFPGGGYVTWGGSSAAAAIAAGALAIVAAEQPGDVVSDIVDSVTSTARPDGVSGLSAYGRLDASAAVARARTR